MSRESQIIDEAVDLLDVADRYHLGWRPRGEGRPFQVHCPMHADSTPSSRVYPSSNSGYCWTCQKSYGPTGLVATLESVSWVQAVQMLSSWYGVNIDPDPDEAEARRLVAMMEGRKAPLSAQEMDELRRVAGLTQRAVNVDWPSAQRLLVAYEVLDLTDINPSDWVDLAQTSLSERLQVG